MEESPTIHKIAIIGGGPKGLYGFERLAAQFKAHPPSDRIEIHIYNRSTFFGGGEIYRTDQPSYLLTNKPAGDINMWTNENPPPVISRPLPLTQWLHLKEGLQLDDEDYVDRASVGRYLKNGFELIASNLPDNVYGKYIVGEVIDLYKDGLKYGVKLKTDDTIIHDGADRYDHVLLATGHPLDQLTEQDEILLEFANKNERTEYIPHIYPTESTFLSIKPGSAIGTKGLGITFIDTVFALTEGKGGEFIRSTRTEKLMYFPSGREPKVIYPFSRSGLPMIPRQPSKWNNTPLKFFTKEAIYAEQSKGKVDFEEQLLPLIKQELNFVFYDIKMKRFGFSDDLDSCESFEEVEQMIDKFHNAYPKAKRFDPDLFLSPLRDKIFLEPESYHQYIFDMLNFYIKEAGKGEFISPWAAVTAVWRKAIPLFSNLYTNSGLTPESQREFDNTFRGLLNRVTFGPPLKSAEKIVALMEAGVLNFEIAQHPDLILDDRSGKFILKSNLYSITRSVDTLVDARVLKISLPDESPPLYKNLLRHGLISMYQNDSEQGSYQPGSVNITENGFVIDKNGSINTDIVVIRSKTEGISYHNEILSDVKNNFVSNWATFICKKYSRLTVQYHSN